ncbi:MAG TPA: VanW family protein [Acidimicrobiales bacterium]|nr:VanW family protein [Acidimicrobiales bacterium]
MRRARRLFVAALLLVAGAAVVLGAAWAVDMQRSSGRVVRNTTLAGHPVGGLDRARLGQVVAGVGGAYQAEPIHVDAPGGGFTLGPDEIGLRLDDGATAAAALAAGRSGNPLRRVADWARSFFDERDVRVAVRVDRSKVERMVVERDSGRTPPTEPTVKMEKGRLEAVGGVSGKGVDPADVLNALPLAAAAGPPVHVQVGRGPIAPRFDIVDAQRLVDAGEAATAKPLEVTVDGQAGEVPAAKLRSWLRSVADGGGLRLGVNTVRAGADLETLFAKLGTPAVETTFTVVNNVPQVVPGVPGTTCCAPDAGARVDAAVQARLAGSTAGEPVALPTRRRDPELTAEQAAALGVKEPVATFTTNHAPNQPRVTNIHRIADLVRGQVIPPGKTFSVNDFVGKRTEEKGFVVDHVIEDGKFSESVGGGISQFATTTFNAAFFAGLEFGEYQSHSLYISRYPYGREATLSYPHPDLKIRNPSPYGVLIWPTYTGRSLTVTLYSTKWVDAQQTNQTTEPRGPCTHVTTERTRRFLDGTVKVDTVGALYRPAEGVNCT